MKSKLFQESPKTMQTTAGRWLRIFPDEGEGHALYDLVHGQPVGRILVDEQDHWIYDGLVLSVEEQEEVAGLIVGHDREMNALLRTAGI